VNLYFEVCQLFSLRSGVMPPLVVLVQMLRTIITITTTSGLALVDEGYQSDPTGVVARGYVSTFMTRRPAERTGKAFQITLLS